jgi:hypothetical protein
MYDIRKDNGGLSLFALKDEILLEYRFILSMDNVNNENQKSIIKWHSGSQFGANVSQHNIGSII